MSVVTMMAAAKRGDVAILRKLMDPVRSGLPGDLAEEDGWTVLHEAVKCNNDECVHELVSNGASVHRFGGLGWTPLHIACRDGFEEVAEYLIDCGADVNASCTFPALAGTTPLHLAAIRGHVGIVDLLLSHRVDKDQKDAAGETALFKAAYSGQLAVVTDLVDRGADTKIRPKKGYGRGKLAWEMAKEEGYLDIVETLNVSVSAS